MPADPRKRQKKLERRSAKRKSKQHHLVRERQAGLPERLTAAAGCPVLHCSVADVLWSQGIGSVLLSRQLPNGEVALGVFLIDRFCLGVKNAIAAIKTRSEYESRFLRAMQKEYRMEDLSPASARKLVEGAVAYAQALGFHPHADYHKAKLLFGDIDASASTEEFEFGKDGKPLFIAGPYDTPEKCRQILRTLEESRGVGGFHEVIPFGESSTDMPRLRDGRIIRMIGPEESGFFRDEEQDFTEEDDADDEPS